VAARISTVTADTAVAVSNPQIVRLPAAKPHRIDVRAPSGFSVMAWLLIVTLGWAWRTRSSRLRTPGPEWHPRPHVLMTETQMRLAA
jgi:hypothetical protein